MKKFILLALLLAACDREPAPLLAPKRQTSPEPTPTASGPLVVPEPLVATAPSPEPSIHPDQDDDMAIATANEPPKNAILALPPKPVLTKAGHGLILEFETGGRSGFDPHPEWPKGASGVTIGIGYDLGYTDTETFQSDWASLSDITVSRLTRTVGLTGERAHAKLSSVHDIMVEWDLSVDVFDNVDVARWFATTKRVLGPKFAELRPNAQAALVSLGFNRGWSMAGDKRIECRVIRDQCVPSEDYVCIAKQIRTMKRIWRGTAIERGMARRRDAEAKLAETP